MADVNITPRVRCDNCGEMADKATDGFGGKIFLRPKSWGSLSVEGGKSNGAYGGKDRLDFVDLCPSCADVALNAAASALKLQRGE